MRPTRNALVIGDDTRSFLATVRSLGRGGVEVHAAPFSFQSPALKSRYISKVHWLPYYFGDGSEWLQAIEDLLRSERFAVVIPCDERALLPLHHHRDRLSTKTRLAIPDPYALEVFFDKNKTRELARRLGVPVAKGRMIQPTDGADTLIAETGLPLAIKPTGSYTLDRLYTRNRVIIATNEAEIADALPKLEAPHFVEAFFPGTGVGVSVLANQGRVLQAFQHRRVHEFQGASYYRVSEALSEPLLDAVSKMIEATGHTGVAMFEFRVDRASGDWILLEVNARPWGSLPLPVAVGADFPYRWYRLLAEGVATSSVPYKLGIYGRNFLPDARQQFARARAIKGPVNLAKFVLRTLSEYARLLVGREVYDILVADDPRPALHELLDKFQEWRAAASISLTRAADRTRHQDQAALRDAASRVGELEIAFVCQGNICRSPMAAALLRRELGRQPEIHIRSFGNLPREGARSPPNAVKAARQWGIDLRDHRSEYFSLKAVQRADLIITFDDTNVAWVRGRYPSSLAPLVRLGSFLSSPSCEPIIADPDGYEITRFERTYGGIADAVGSMAQQIRDARND